MKDDLRKMVAQLRLSESARITSEARKRRYERQAKDALTPEERDRRMTTLTETFESWAFGDELIPLFKVRNVVHFISSLSFSI